MSKRKTINDSVKAESKILTFLAQHNGTSSSSGIYKFASEKLGIKSESTVYLSLTQLEQTGIVSRVKPSPSEFFKTNATHEKSTNWALQGGNIADLSRLFVFLCNQNQRNNLLQLVLGRVVNSSWYISRLNEIVIPDNKEIPDFLMKLDKFADMKNVTFDFENEVVDYVKDNFHASEEDIRETMFETVGEPDIKVTIATLREFGLKGNAKLNELFYRLFYITCVSDERYPDGSEVTGEDKGIMEYIATRTKNLRKEMGYGPEDLAGSLTSFILIIQKIAIEGEGFGMYNVKDPDLREFISKKMKQFRDTG